MRLSMLCRSCSLLMTEWSLKSQIWKTIFAPVIPYTLPDDCILATLYYCYCYCSYTYWCSTYTYSQSSANQHKIHLNVHWCCAEKLFIYCQSTLKFQYCHKSGKKKFICSRYACHMHYHVIARQCFVIVPVPVKQHVIEALVQIKWQSCAIVLFYYMF